MERAEQRRGSENPLIITLQPTTLIALCGPAGSGKSTFAAHLIANNQAQGFVDTMIVSSDHCRALICDDESNQQVSRDSFDLFHYIIYKRLLQKRLTIADSTALRPLPRQKMLDLAHQHQFATCLLIFNLPLEVYRQRDRSRKRMVGDQVIDYHMRLLQQTLLDAPQEGWQLLHVLSEQDLERGIQVKIVADH